MDNQISRLLRLPQVQAQVGLSKSQIYKLIEQGEFPRQIKVCQRVSAWLASDVDSWIDQRVLESQEEQLELPFVPKDADE